MSANTNNALLFLISAVFDLAVCLFLLRVLLQLVRADFYNPISQLVWRMTQPIIIPMTRALPRYKRFDIASALVVLVLAMIEVEAIGSVLSAQIPLLLAAWFALLKVAAMLLRLYTLSLFVQAILSWVGPGTSNPAANVLWSLNEPLLRPVRRILPAIAGLDLSPLVVMIALQVVYRLLPLPGFFV